MNNLHNSFRNLVVKFALVCSFSGYGYGYAQEADLELYERQLFLQGEDTLACRILSPAHFSPEKKYPLLVFLHGSGERGSDNESQLKWGGELFLDSAYREKFPAIVVFPQCPADSSWSVRIRKKDSIGQFTFPTDVPPTRPLQLVMDFIDTLISSGIVDVNRIYIGGLSMGGFGTFEILWRRPQLFAAAFPICGGGNPAMAKSYGRNFPVWVFHGEKDEVVAPVNSHIMVEALKKANAKVKYTEYPDVKHDSWINAFAEPELLPWLFSQKR
ncbi:MAG: prolyl oligopeptidase family serine peptidase [Chitinophagaceae bacterium]|nr:prolyl oligopeptidase family serine peptidase [Chitinophagaceae bacterium]MCW5925524.1 prolyl oligopeptidase family serine peptidase [Chitinophagaceae bacterium]